MAKSTLWQILHPEEVREEKGELMAKYHLKCTADGRHQVVGPNGESGEVDDAELRDYATRHLKMWPPAGASAPAEHREGTASQQFREAVKEAACTQRLSEGQARLNVLATDRGKALWEAMREDELAESAVLEKFTQDMR
jgi:hypothetical protein